jgi:tetratricopeptide (TPR) repeat protein
MAFMHHLRCFALLALLAVLGAALPAAAGEVQDIHQQYRNGDKAGALAKITTYLQKNPKDAQGRFLKGLILADQGKTNEAIPVFISLTEDFPELPEPYNNLAVLYAGQGKYDAAKNALEMAIRTHPSYATAHENLGDLYARMASLAYDKALQLDSKNASAQAKLAFIQDMMTGLPKPGKPTKSTQVASATSSQPASAALAVKPSAKPVEPVASKPVTKPEPARTPAGDAPAAAEFESLIQAWTQAWAGKDVEGYLGFYSRNFNPSKGSRNAWEASRRANLSAPAKISITFSDVELQKLSPDRVVTRFSQDYQSNLNRSDAPKTLEWVREGAKWLIVRESGR